MINSAVTLACGFDKCTDKSSVVQNYFANQGSGLIGVVPSQISK